MLCLFHECYYNADPLHVGITDMARIGRPPTDNPKVRHNVGVPRNVNSSLERLARQMGITPAVLIERIVVHRLSE